MIIAIDGPAGAGKSTTARLLAQRLGFSYIDTGAMYRAVALAAFERGLSPEEDTPEIVTLANSLGLRLEEGGTRVFIGPREVSAEIRAPHIAALTSKVAAIAAVRSAMVQAQQKLGRAGESSCGGAVLEGRDIQTVVFPHADVKIFLEADARTRAQRRVWEWAQGGQSEDVEQTERDLIERDERDSGRDTAPLKPADDALILSTEGKSPEQVVEEIVALVEERRGGSASTCGSGGSGGSSE